MSLRQRGEAIMIPVGYLLLLIVVAVIIMCRVTTSTTWRSSYRD